MGSYTQFLSFYYGRCNFPGYINRKALDKKSFPSNDALVTCIILNKSVFVTYIIIIIIIIIIRMLYLLYETKSSFLHRYMYSHQQEMGQR